MKAITKKSRAPQAAYQITDEYLDELYDRLASKWARKVERLQRVRRENRKLMAA